jgi:hypothetical protein
MSYIDMFANTMFLFWILVQQVCLCCAKWAYEDILGRTSTKRYVAFHAVIFLTLVILAFDTLFGVDIVFGMLPIGALRFYGRLKWNFLCDVMLILDALLVFYGLRIYRMYMSERPKTPSRTRVRTEDFIVAAGFLLFFIAYHRGMTDAILTYNLSGAAVRRLQFVFIRICGFFYMLFEGSGAVLLWRVYMKSREKAYKAEKAPARV